VAATFTNVGNNQVVSNANLDCATGEQVVGVGLATTGGWLGILQSRPVDQDTWSVSVRKSGSGSHTVTVTLICIATPAP
jgi:hypothetical protein